MNLTYPINFISHDEWMESGYSLSLAHGEVITRDGEVIGTWRAVDYQPDADNEGGRYEFIADGQTTPLFAETFACLDYRVSRGLALSNLTRSVREWYDGLGS